MCDEEENVKLKAQMTQTLDQVWSEAIEKFGSADQDAAYQMAELLIGVVAVSDIDQLMKLDITYYLNAVFAKLSYDVLVRQDDRKAFEKDFNS